MKTYTGIDIRDNIIRIIQMQRESNYWQLINIFYKEVKEKNELIETLKKINLKNTFINTSISLNKVAVKYLNLPSNKRSEINKILDFEMEEYIPFPANEAITDFDLLPEKPELQNQPNIFLVATRKDVIDEYFNILSLAGLSPDIISITSLANINNLITGNIIKGCFAFIVIENKIIEINIVSDSIPCFSRSFFIGESALGDYSHWIEELISEIKGSFDAFQKSIFKNKIEKIFICCDNKKFDNLKSLMEKQININIEYFDIFKNINTCQINISEQFQNPWMFSVAIGSIFCNEFSKIKINLLPREILLKQIQIKKKRKILLIGSILLFVFILILTIFIKDTYRKIIELKTLETNIKKLRPAVKKAEEIVNQFKVYEEFSEGGIVPLNIIRELSILLPSNLYIYQFYYDKEKFNITIKGRTDSFSTASRLPIILSKSKFFYNIINKNSKEIVFEDKKLVEFEIELSIKNEIK